MVSPTAWTSITFFFHNIFSKIMTSLYFMIYKRNLKMVMGFYCLFLPLMYQNYQVQSSLVIKGCLWKFQGTVASVSPQLIKSRCAESKSPHLSEPLYTEVIDINSLNHAKNAALPLERVGISFVWSWVISRPIVLEFQSWKPLFFHTKGKKKITHPLENPLYPW